MSRTILIFLGVVVLAGLALVAYQLFHNLELRVSLADQPAHITIPEPLRARVSIAHPVQVRLDDTLRTRVPISHDIAVRLDSALDVVADIDTILAVQADIHVRETVTINQLIEVDASIQARVLGMWREIPIRGQFPFRAEIPVDLTIPLDERVKVRGRVPAKARLTEDIVVPLRMHIEAEVPVRGSFSVPVTQPMEVEVQLPDAPSRILIDHSELWLPLRTLGLRRASDAEEGRATPSATDAEPPHR